MWKKCYVKCGVWNQMRIWSSHLLDNLSNGLWTWKIQVTKRDSNPWPLRCRCSALTKWATKSHSWEPVNLLGSCFPVKGMWKDTTFENSKLIEKSACLQLNKYLVNNSLHEPLQSAYKVGHSTCTETALLAITDDILLSLDRGENVFLVLLDLSAAFDTVNHSRLLSRLQDTFGI